MKKNILLFLILLFLLKPTGLENISPFLNLSMNVFRLLSMILVLLFYLICLRNKKIKINKCIVLFGLIEIFSIICCLYNKQSCYNAIVYWHGILSLMMLAEIESKDSYNFLKIVTVVLGFYILVNFTYTLFIYNTISYNTVFFLGKKNMVVLYVFPFIYFLLHLNCIDRNGKKNIFMIFFLLISLFSVYITFSATAIFGCFLLGLYFIFANIKVVNKLILKIKAKNILYLILLFSILIIVLNIQKYFSFIIIKTLGRDLTFTGRTFVWKRAITLILENPFGYGWDTIIPNVESILNLNESVDIGHAHNYILNLTYKSSIFASIIFIILLIFVAQKIDKCSNINLSGLMKVGFIILLLLITFESYPTNCISVMFLCYLFFNYEKFNKENKVEL